MFMAKFYWREYVPIWTLLGDHYKDEQIKIVVSFMSWTWMVGVVAAQILASRDEDLSEGLSQYLSDFR